MDNKKIFKYSSIFSLAMGNYKGELKIKDVMKNYDTGIGTFDMLDGEMIVIGGKCYQIKSNGTVNEDTDELLTPYIEVAKFVSDIKFELNDINFEKINNVLNKKISNNKHNVIVLKIKGLFKKIKTRSVSKQKKIGEALNVVAKNQKEFVLENLEGDIVGIYTPDIFKTLGVKGFHFHFIDTDRKFGGHLIDFDAKKLIIEMMYINNVDFHSKSSDFKKIIDFTEVSEIIKVSE